MMLVLGTGMVSLGGCSNAEMEWERLRSKAVQSPLSSNSTPTPPPTVPPARTVQNYSMQNISSGGGFAQGTTSGGRQISAVLMVGVPGSNSAGEPTGGGKIILRNAVIQWRGN